MNPMTPETEKRSPAMKTEREHTPTPLIISPFSPLRIEQERQVYEPLLGKDITVTATVLEVVPGKGNDLEAAKEFAAFIVRAVNAHDELLSALIELLTAHTILFPSEEAGKEAQDAWADRREKARENAYAAIAKAESSPGPR